MERLSRALRALVKHLKDSRGVSLYEITAAVAMTGILAAVAVPVIIDKVTEAKQAAAVQETDAIYKAMQAFQTATGKLPGQAEDAVLLVSNGAVFPGGALGDAIKTFCGTVGNGTGAGKCQDMNKYLVEAPNSDKYPNWKGPYIDPIVKDPFDRAYLVNVQALYKIDGVVTGGTSSGGGTIGNVGGVPCGYGWVISGGPNREIETSFFTTSVNPVTSDDLGRSYGKKSAPGSPCLSAAGQ